MDNIKYQIHNLLDVWDEVEKLSKEHLRDTVSLNIIPDLDLDLEALHSMCKTGEVLVVLASNSEEVVGYCIYILHPEILKKGIYSAVNLAIYVVDKYRGNLTFKFIKKCDNILFESVEAVSRITKTHSDMRMCKMVERCGYKKDSITLVKKRNFKNEAL